MMMRLSTDAKLISKLAQLGDKIAGYSLVSMGKDVRFRQIAKKHNVLISSSDRGGGHKRPADALEGFFGVLACHEDVSTRIATFAPVSGAFYETGFGTTCDTLAVDISTCNPDRTDMPVLNFHGLAGDAIGYHSEPRREEGALLAEVFLLVSVVR